MCFQTTHSQVDHLMKIFFLFWAKGKVNRFKTNCALKCGHSLKVTKCLSLIYGFLDQIGIFKVVHVYPLRWLGQQAEMVIRVSHLQTRYDPI